MQKLSVCRAAIAAGCCCLATFAAAAETPEPPSLSVVQWNVENLFDAVDDPANEGDDEFTPEGWQHWSERRYAVKLTHLAEALARLGADIVCVEEIENRRVLDDLAALLRSRHKLDYPFILHREGTDHRGIDVAVLSRVPPRETRWLTPVAGQRDVLVAVFAEGGVPLTLFVNHWKSRWGPEATATRLRREQAQRVRAEIDRLLTVDPAAAIMLVGDFNDDFDDPIIVNDMRSIGDAQRVLSEPDARWLYNLHGGLDEEARGTFYYRRDGVWDSFDTMSVTRAMLPEAGGDGGPRWVVRPGSYGVFRPELLVDGKGRPLPFRMLTNEDTGQREYCSGYSDHLPVRVVVELR